TVAWRRLFRSAALHKMDDRDMAGRGLITLGVKRTGKRRTGNPFAPFEVAGAGDGPTANLHGQEAGNGGYSQGEPSGAPRQSSTLLRAGLGARLGRPCGLSTKADLP